MKPFAVEISFRVRAKGQGLLDTPSASPSAYRRHDTLYLLVHGFNVSKQEADESYEQFRETFRKFDAADVADKLGAVYWPGDHPFKLISLERFHTQIPVAIKTGFRLEKFLQTLPSRTGEPYKLVLIGHSLGCRIILEALAHMAERDARSKAKRRHVRIFLMAAGVPVQMVELNGRLRPAAEYAATSHVFCSIGDEALYAFPIGQKRAKERGVTKFEPVGKLGNPPNLWTKSYSENEHLHGSYWHSYWAVGLILRALGEPAPKDTQARRPRGKSLRKWSLRTQSSIRSRKLENRRR